MMHTRRMTLRRAATFAVPILGVHALWAAAIFGLYAFGGVEALCIPFLPVATVGTAVAFYVGFKNNSAYDRFWEGRKIWGALVNVSRGLAHQLDAQLMNTAPDRRAVYAEQPLCGQEQPRSGGAGRGGRHKLPAQGVHAHVRRVDGVAPREGVSTVGERRSPAGCKWRARRFRL